MRVNSLKLLLIVVLNLLAAPLHAQQYSKVTYCIDPDWLPYEALRNGAHIGISADYLSLLTELTDLKFELIKTDSWTQTMEFARQGRCMLVTMLNKSPSRSRFLEFSDPYVEAPNVLVAQEGTPMIQGYSGIGNRLVGIVEGYRHAEYLARYYPEVQVEYVQSENEGLRKLEKGNLDLMIGSLLSVNVNMNSMGFDDLVIAGYAEPYDSLRFGVHKDHADLIPILNAGIEAIPESRRVEIYKRWNNAVVIDKRSYMPFIFGSLIIITVLAVVAWKRKVQSKWEQALTDKNDEIESLQSVLLEKNRTLEFLSNHDSLTGLYNRNHMMQKAEEEISRFLRFHTSASLIVLELGKSDDLQQSPNFSENEAVLKGVANICLTTVREVDIAARWGGEQFLILCPQTPISAAKVLADRLIEAMQEPHVFPGQNVRFAVGVASLESNETFTDWYDRAAKALYQSRRQGFNVTCIAD